MDALDLEGLPVSNRKATDTFERCPNTNAAGVCMYIGPCLSCYDARARQRKAEWLASDARNVAVDEARAALGRHMALNVGACTGDGMAGVEFDRLYHMWIRARWDASDAWVRSVWKVRP